MKISSPLLFAASLFASAPALIHSLRLTAVVVGGSGALGGAFVEALTASNRHVINIALTASNPPSSLVTDVLVNPSKSMADQKDHIINSLSSTLKTLGSSVDCVICTAGGWRGGKVGDDDIFEKLSAMNAMNTDTAVLAAHIASKSLNEGGMLVLTGAGAALDGVEGKRGTEGMVSDIVIE